MTPTQQQYQPPKKVARVSPELRRRIVILCAKIVGIFLIFYILAFRIYGFIRIDTNVMSPTTKGGDLALIFHLNSDYSIGDVVSYKCEKRTCIGRVVAKAGDTIDINEEGKITINGHLEDLTTYGDYSFPENSTVSYPYKVADDLFFILGDNRNEWDDSRTFGAINKNEITGQIIGIFRTHAI